MSENTARCALQFEEVYDDTLDMIFIDEEHRDFFLLSLERMKNVDERHLALAYCLGLNEKVRQRADAKYKEAREEMKEVLVAKSNIDQILQKEGIRKNAKSKKEL